MRVTVIVHFNDDVEITGKMVSPYPPASRAKFLNRIAFRVRNLLGEGNEITWDFSDARSSYAVAEIQKEMQEQRKQRPKTDPALDPAVFAAQRAAGLARGSEQGKNDAQPPTPPPPARRVAKRRTESTSTAPR